MSSGCRFESRPCVIRKSFSFHSASLHCVIQISTVELRRRTEKGLRVGWVERGERTIEGKLRWTCTLQNEKSAQILYTEATFLKVVANKMSYVLLYIHVYGMQIMGL